MSTPHPIWCRQALATPASQPEEHQTLTSLNTVALVDISGSTHGAILKAEKSLVAHLNVRAVVAWDNRSHVLDVQVFLHPLFGSSGGTLPTCVLESPVSAKLIKDSNAVVFTTDGQVAPEEIQRMSTMASDHFGHLALLVCVLFRPTLVNTLTNELSVFAPTLLLPRTLVLEGSIDPKSQDYRVVFASPAIKELLRGCNTMTLQELSDLRVPPYESVPLPPGYRLLNNGVGFSLSNLLDIKEYVDLPEADWCHLHAMFANVAQLAKHEVVLPQLRAWVDKMHSQLTQHSLQAQKQASQEYVSNTMELTSLEIRLMMDEITSRLSGSGSPSSSTSSSGRDRLINELTLDELRQQLRDLYREHDQGRKELVQHIESSPRVRTLNNLLRDVQTWLAQLQSAESSTYSEVDMARNLGNRAKRAALVDITTGSTTSITTTIDWTDAPTQECRICLSVEHACLILRHDPNRPDDRREALDVNGSDYCMNCPLAFGRQNLVFLSPDVYCPSCTQYLVSSTGLDTNRSKISGVIPVCSWVHEPNVRYVHHQLAVSLAEGRMLPHLKLLMYALIDHAQVKDWTSDYRPLLTYLKEQMSNHLEVPIDFEPGNTKAPLVRVSSQMVLDALNTRGRQLSLRQLPVLLAQPIASTTMLIRNSRLGMKIPAHDLQALGTERYLLLLVQRWCWLINNQVSIAWMTHSILDTLYDMDGLGVPRYHSGRPAVSVPSIGQTRSPLLQRLVDDTTQAEIDRDWHRTWTTHVDNHPTLPLAHSVSVSLLLKALLSSSYQTLEQWVSCHQVALNEAVHARTTTTVEELVVQLNKYMFRSLPASENKTDVQSLHAHLDQHRLPPCVTVNGPSTLFCVCGEAFLEEEPDQIKTVDEVVRSVVQKRRAHFHIVYGSELPSDHSSHTNLYSSCIATVREAYPPTETFDKIPDVPSRALVLRTLQRLYKKGGKADRGNIFSQQLLSHVATVLNNYLPVWRLVVRRAQAHSQPLRLHLECSVSFKIASELKGREGASWDGSYTHEEWNRARQAAVRCLDVRGVDRQLSAPLTKDEVLQVLPTVQIISRG